MHYLAATLLAALVSTAASASDQAPSSPDTETLTLLGIGLVGLSIVLRKNR